MMSGALTGGPGCLNGIVIIADDSGFGELGSLVRLEIG